MMKRIRASEVSRHLPWLLDRVARGESLTITLHGKRFARLAPNHGPRCWQVANRLHRNLALYIGSA